MQPYIRGGILEYFPATVEALAPLLDAEDEAVAAAAAHAIARLGSPKAAELLEPRISAKIAPAILVCGIITDLAFVNDRTGIVVTVNPTT